MALIAAVLPGALARPALAKTARSNFSAAYQGSYTETDYFQGTGAAAGVFLKTTQTESFYQSVVITVTSTGEVTQSAGHLSVQGTVTQTSNQPPQPGCPPCVDGHETCTIAANPANTPSELSGLTALGVALKDERISEVDVGVQSDPVPISAFVTLTGADCEDQLWGTVQIPLPDSSAQTTQLQHAQFPSADVPLGKLPFSRNVGANISNTESGTGYTETATITWKATLAANATNVPPPNVGPSGANPSPTGNGPTPAEKAAREKIKRAALPALRDHLRQSVYPCLIASAGGILATSGFLMSFSPGFGGGLSLLGAGTPMLGVAGPICAKLVATIEDEAQTVDDPPSGHYRRLASAATPRGGTAGASCTSFSGASATLCARLEAALGKLDGKLGEVESIAAAIKTTIGRETAAIDAGDAAAAASQARHGRALDAELITAERAQTQASRGVAVLLRSYHLNIELTKLEFAKGAAAIRRYLKAKGIPAATLDKLAGKSLEPASLDEVAELARPYG